MTAANKPYDGTFTAKTTCSLVGVLAADAANVTCSAGVASFATDSVGTGITVTATGIVLSGSATGNYLLSFTSATTTANISADVATVTVTVSCPSGIIYDGATHGCTASATGAGGAAVSGTMVITYNGSTTAPSSAGTYSVIADFTPSAPNYASASGSGSRTIQSCVIAKLVTRPNAQQKRS